MAKKTKMGAPALYKVLMDGCPIWGGALEYSLPTEAGPGEWHEVEGDIVRCKNGLHLTDDPARRWQDGAECYLVETGQASSAPPHMEAALSVAARKAAQEEIGNWQERIRRAESAKKDADKTIAYALDALKKLRAKGEE